MSFRTFSIAALVVAGAQLAVPASAASVHRLECQATTELVKLSRPLAKMSARLVRNEDITILALGSSSTYGTGASKTEFSYPSRLEQELHTLLPKAKVKVINRGIGGEDAQQMLARLDRDLHVAELGLAEEQPAVVRRVLAADDHAILDAPVAGGLVSARPAVAALRGRFPPRERVAIEERLPRERDGSNRGVG